MSQKVQSRTKALKVKGVSFNYLQFLWSQIGQIRSVQQHGDFAGAMKLIASLIPYLPESIKDEFRGLAFKIQQNLSKIRAGDIKQIQDTPDLFMRGIFKNRLLQGYSQWSLNDFMDKLSTKLDEGGYMENTTSIPEGEGELEDDWIRLQEKRKRREKRRAASPSGSMD